MTGVHSYLQETLKLKDCLGKMRLKLEKNLKSIKSVAPAAMEISVWETYRVSQEVLALAKAEVFRTKRKFVPGRTIDLKQKKRPVEATTPNQTVAMPTLAPAWKKGYRGPTKNFWCGKLSHFIRNCKFKDVVAAMVLDNSGKDEGLSM